MSDPSTARAALILACLATIGTCARGQESRGAAPDLEAGVVELQRLVDARRSADAWKKAATLAPLLEKDGVPPTLRARAKRLSMIAGIEVIGPAAAFKGVVVVGESGAIEVTYDFKVATWQDDFELVPILPTAKTVDEKSSKVEGTVALCHAAIWAAPLAIEIEGRPLIATDFGPVLVDADEANAERFLTGFHNNAYFGIKYGSDRAVSEGHVLLLAGRGAVSRAKTRPTQLLGRTPTPAIARGNEVKSSLSVKGVKAEFRTATSPTSTAILTFDLAAATQTYARMRPGLLVRDSSFELSRIVIRGRLDPAWAKEQTDRLRATLGSEAPAPR